MTEKQRQELCERFSQIFAVANPDPNVPFEEFIYDAMLKAFIAGAEYAWNNPKWISVDENNLPPKLKGKQYTEYYFVYSSRGVQKMRYNYDRRDWQDERGMMFIAIQGVTNWMPLPQPPRKED